MKNLWRWKCGLSESELIPEKINLDELKQSEWSIDFERFMRNRLIMGAIRYGKIHEKNKPQYDRIDSMKKRIGKYIKSGNKEYLVDIANLCLLEFEECTHTNQHFYSIDDSEHVKTII